MVPSMCTHVSNLSSFDSIGLPVRKDVEWGFLPMCSNRADDGQTLSSVAPDPDNSAVGSCRCPSPQTARVPASRGFISVEDEVVVERREQLFNLALPSCTSLRINVRAPLICPRRELNLFRRLKSATKPADVWKSRISSQGVS
jgi:hypothetical protein